MISIICPVYNRDQYLDALVKSVMSQTYGDWELLLVDDGSTDSSGEICDGYAMKDPRVKVWHQSNEGVSSARNKGLSMASGEYIYFADADDELLPDCLSTLLDHMKPGVDLVTASYIRNENNEIVPEYIFKEGFNITACQYFDVISVLPNARFCERYLTTKLFRKSIITYNSVLFDLHLHYREDVEFLYKYVSFCEGRIVGIDIPVYVYYRRSSGAAEKTNASLNQHTANLFYSTERYLDIVKSRVKSSKAERSLKKILVNDYYRIVQRVVRSRSLQFSLIRSLNKRLFADLSAREFFSIRLKELYRMISFNVKRKIRKK